jgi:hypothetical protein
VCALAANRSAPREDSGAEAVNGSGSILMVGSG